MVILYAICRFAGVYRCANDLVGMLGVLRGEFEWFGCPSGEIQLVVKAHVWLLDSRIENYWKIKWVYRGICRAGGKSDTACILGNPRDWIKRMARKAEASTI